MHLVSAAKLLLSATLLGAATAHNIQLPAHGRECFHESLHRDDKMTVTFQVGDREFGSAGNLDIDFWVCISPAIGGPPPFPLPLSLLPFALGSSLGAWGELDSIWNSN